MTTMEEHIEKHASDCGEKLDLKFIKKPNTFISIGSVIALVSIAFGIAAAYYTQENKQDYNMENCEEAISSIQGNIRLVEKKFEYYTVKQDTILQEIRKISNR